MSFPIDYRGRIIWHQTTTTDPNLWIKAFLDSAEIELNKAKARDVRQEGNSILFEVAPFRLVARSNILAAIDKGSISITSNVNDFLAQYCISFKRFLITMSLTWGAIASLFLLLPKPLIDRVAAVFGVFMLGWLWVFGVNYLIMVLRYHHFVKDILKKTNEPNR